MKPLKDYAYHPYQLSLSAWDVVKKIFTFLFANKTPVRGMSPFTSEKVALSNIVLVDLCTGLSAGLIAGLAVLVAALAVELWPVLLIGSLFLGMGLLGLIAEKTSGHSLLPLSLLISLPMIAAAAGAFVFSATMMGLSLVADLIALPFKGLAGLLKPVREFMFGEPESDTKMPAPAVCIVGGKGLGNQKSDAPHHNTPPLSSSSSGRAGKVYRVLQPPNPNAPRSLALRPETEGAEGGGGCSEEGSSGFHLETSPHRNVSLVPPSAPSADQVNVSRALLFPPPGNASTVQPSAPPAGEVLGRRASVS
ncbi:MAG: hypothetical protein DHS20C10_09120 [marine bacterium B5-7]|nr:MAG: hypothetical protein DHS20C10_09120 [marine bacterium B5-7]